MTSNSNCARAVVSPSAADSCPTDARAICAPLRPPEYRFCENDNEARQVFFRPKGRSSSPTGHSIRRTRRRRWRRSRSARSISATRASRAACGLSANGGHAGPVPSLVEHVVEFRRERAVVAGRRRSCGRNPLRARI